MPIWSNAQRNSQKADIFVKVTSYHRFLLQLYHYRNENGGITIRAAHKVKWDSLQREIDVIYGAISIFCVLPLVSLGRREMGFANAVFAPMISS